MGLHGCYQNLLIQYYDTIVQMWVQSSLPFSPVISAFWKVKIQAYSLLENLKGAVLEQETRLIRHKTFCRIDSPDPRTMSQSIRLL